MEQSARSQEAQLLLAMSYRENVRHGIVPSFKDVGFRQYSQFEEDGILWFIFAAVGAVHRTVVEVCCGNGRQSMSANLIVNHGWRGLLVEGDPALVADARRFYRSQRDCLLNQPVVKQAWVTAENINALTADQGFVGEIDLLSLDMDGNDFWVWKALDIISPRVCVVETHNIVPSHLSLTIPYAPRFSESIPDFRGASALAMVRLARQKGYRLIGAHRHGFNAFFMRNDVGRDLFPEVSVESIHDNWFTRQAQSCRWPIVEGLPWQRVEAVDTCVT